MALLRGGQQQLPVENEASYLYVLCSCGDCVLKMMCLKAVRNNDRALAVDWSCVFVIIVSNFNVVGYLVRSIIGAFNLKNFNMNHLVGVYQ